MWNDFLTDAAPVSDPIRGASIVPVRTITAPAPVGIRSLGVTGVPRVPVASLFQAIATVPATNRPRVNADTLAAGPRAASYGQVANTYRDGRPAQPRQTTAAASPLTVPVPKGRNVLNITATNSVTKDAARRRARLDATRAGVATSKDAAASPLSFGTLALLAAVAYAATR